MAHRYSRSEKEKWVADSSRSAKRSPPRFPARRSPVRIPASDNSALIAENYLSLVGRVTNHVAQNTRQIIAFLPQLWNMEGRVNGRILGREKFQFRFETEADLITVLNKSPYHFKDWMLILQRWEPIVSDSFPSQITFWISIVGIPPHIWNDQTIRTIGHECGASQIQGGCEWVTPTGGQNGY